MAVRQLRSQYDHLVLGTMALRLISGRDGFSNFLSRFKILRGHLDQTRPNSSSNVRKQISIGCYYDLSVFTLFNPVRCELLGRTEDEYKCNRGITQSIDLTVLERALNNQRDITFLDIIRHPSTISAQQAVYSTFIWLQNGLGIS